MDEHEIEVAVLAYLRQHPQAADTARGITNWWLPRRTPADSAIDIGRVLERLVAAGHLHAVKLPSGEVLYALGREPDAPRMH